MPTFTEHCEQARYDALRAPFLTDEERAAHLSAVAAQRARDEAPDTVQGDLLEPRA